MNNDHTAEKGRPSFFKRLFGTLMNGKGWEQKQKRKDELEPRRQEILTAFYAEIDKQLRQPSIAQLGGFKPDDDPSTSWFGNILLAKPGETWPEYEGKPMCPLIQINLDQAPLKPSKLNEYALITVFMAKEFPFDTPNGEGWLVRAYESLEGLVPLEKPTCDFPIKALPIQWEEGQMEGPTHDDVPEIVDSKLFEEFNIIEADDDLYYDRYQNSDCTKLGGWPSLIQCGLGMEIDEFVFQVGSEEKGNWMWIDSGIGYFGLDASGNWKFECQFF